MDLEDIIKRRGKMIPNKKPLSIEIKKSISLLIFTLLLIIILIVIVYLLNSTQGGQKGYVLTGHQMKEDQLKTEFQELTDKITQAKIYQNIQNNPLVKAMVKPDNIQYIKEKQTNN